MTREYNVSGREDEKAQKIAKGRSHYIALVALGIGTVIIIIIIALLKNDIIGDDDDDDKSYRGTTPTPREQLEAKLATLQTFIGGSPTARLSNFSNWDGTATRDNVFVVAPSNLDEIRRVLRAARQARMKVRCVGSAYSFSDLYADERQMLLETHGLRTRHDGPPMELKQPMPGVDLWTVTAAAGLSQLDLKKFFLDNGVQYRSTVTPFNVLIGGLIGAASHGASPVRGSVSDLVVAVRVVDSDGRLKSYNSLQHPDQIAMLKCCVGMCGVIYDVTFRVEKLTVTKLEHLFKTSKEMMEDTTWLVDNLQTSDMLMYWAPFSSLTYDHWQEYSTTGKIPSSYDPWMDFNWIRSYTPTGATTLPEDADTTRRRRSVLEHSYMPPVVTGRDIHGTPLYRQKRQTGSNTTEGPITDPVVTEGPITDPVVTEEPIITDAGTEVPPTGQTYSILQDIHQVAWNQTYGWFGNAPPVDMFYPDAVMFQDGETMDITYSMAFTFKDDAMLSTTKKCLTFVFEKLRQESREGRMPHLTMEMDWIQPSRNCYLCPQATANNDTDAAYWFSLTLIGAFYKPNYEPYMNQIFKDLKAEFPDMRVEWAKFYSFVEDLQPFIRESYGDFMTSFQDVHKRSDVDPGGLFTNKYLRGIFTRD